MIYKRFLLILLIITCVLQMGTRYAAAQSNSDIPREYVLKAAWLYHFGKLSEWEGEVEGTGDNFVIAVLGKNPFGNNLHRIRTLKQTIHGKTIQIQQFNSRRDFETRYTGCHILFISPDAPRGSDETRRQRLQAALMKTRGKPVLLVSDSSNFERRGVTINFFADNRANRLKFRINTDVAARANINVENLIRLSNAEQISNRGNGG